MAMLVAGHAAWPWRWLMVGCGLLVAAGSLALWRHLSSRDRRAVEHHLDALVSLDLRQLGQPTALADLPPLPPSSPWRPLAERLRQALAALGEQLQESHQRRAALEARLRRASQEVARARAVLEAISDPVLAVDGAGQVAMANRAARQLLDLDPAATEQRPLQRLSRCQELIDLLIDSSQGTLPAGRSNEVQVADPSGTVRSYRVHCGPLEASTGEQPPAGPGRGGAVAVLRDIGREQELRKRNAEFVSAVSHEMKTPLAGIKAYVELLAEGEAEEEQTREEFLRVIDGQADRLQRLIDNLLCLARIEAGVVEVNKKNGSLNEVLEEGVRVVQPAADAKSIHLDVQLSPLYLGVHADRDMLLQAAINLLSNAIKYTPEGGRVTIRSRLADDHVVFEIEDTGVGLDPEDCRRIFDKFYRVQKNHRMASGTGLGLPLARHIVEDVHGGRLTVHSVPGQGSTFAVTLPKSHNPGT